MDPLFDKLVKLRTTLIISKLHEHDPQFYELIPYIEQNLESLQKIREKDIATGTYPDGHFKLLDLIQFISINILDFLTVFQSYFDSKQKWSKNFFCRQLALIIYEFTDDIHLTINETLRKNDEIDKVDVNLKSQINSVIKKLGFIKQLKYDEHLREVRNQTAAHKEEDVQKLYEKILKTDETLIVACAMFIGYWIHEMFDLIRGIPEKMEAIRTT
jgi:hypothetical protein